MQTIVALLLSGDPQVETELSIKLPWDRHLFARWPGSRPDGVDDPAQYEKPHADDGCRWTTMRTTSACSAIRSMRKFPRIANPRNLPLPFLHHWYPKGCGRITFRASSMAGRVSTATPCARDILPALQSRSALAAGPM